MALVLVRELAETVIARIGMAEVRELGAAPGAALEHLLLNHPFYPRQVPVILGDHVTVEAGTGAVHTAPGHGEEDFDVGKDYDLPAPGGKFTLEQIIQKKVPLTIDQLGGIARATDDPTVIAVPANSSISTCWATLSSLGPRTSSRLATVSGRPTSRRCRSRGAPRG